MLGILRGLASSFMRRQVNVLHCTKPSLACLAREFPAALA